MTKDFYTFEDAIRIVLYGSDEEKKIVKGDFEWEQLHPIISEEHSLSV